MIAACPKCSARYRIEREKLKAEGVRLRCSRCEAVFRVRPPAEEAEAEESPPRVVEREPAPAPAPAPAPRAPEAPRELPFDGSRGVLLAVRDAAIAKQTAEVLRERGWHVLIVQDGVEAMLEIQRKLPRTVVLASDLPKMFGFQICEVVKRNESLRAMQVVLAGAIHHPDRYRRPPGELYGADAYLEVPDLPEALLPLLERSPASGPDRAPAPPAARAPAPAPEEVRPAATPRAAADVTVPAAGEPAAPGVDPAQHAKAERLARIIVSDIILYNEAKFAEAVRRGDVATALEADLAEGRALFRERIPEALRESRDYLVAELLRVARSRGMK